MMIWSGIEIPPEGMLSKIRYSIHSRYKATCSQVERDLQKKRVKWWAKRGSTPQELEFYGPVGPWNSSYTIIITKGWHKKSGRWYFVFFISYHRSIGIRIGRCKELIVSWIFNTIQVFQVYGVELWEAVSCGCSWFCCYQQFSREHDNYVSSLYYLSSFYKGGWDRNFFNLLRQSFLFVP